MGTVEDEERAGITGGAPASAPAAARRSSFVGREEEYLEAEREQDAERLAKRRHDEVMGALRRVYGKLLDMEKRVVAIERRPPSTSGPSRSDDGGLDLDAVAGDRDLDGPKGDPLVKYDPKSWKGDSYANYKFSETCPAYLDEMAKYLSSCAYMAAKDPDEKKRNNAKWKALDAARARGWAKRLRAGWGGAAPITSGSAAQGQASAAGAPTGPTPPPGDGVMF